MSESVLQTKTGAILYDPAIVNQISAASFTPRGWAVSSQVEGALKSGGRGRTLVVGDGESEFVLRHYFRGGLPGRFLRDAYLWNGEDRTRSFMEWRLLVKLCELGLPVPQPAAASYSRRGLVYRADLLTVRIPGIRSLADRIASAPLPASAWQRIGRGIAGFHAKGVNHADLNAYNVQLDDEGKLWLLDFDRGRIMPPGVWQQKNLARLNRSLRKIRAARPDVAFSQGDWRLLVDAYFRESRSA